jgi:transcription elongation GreA/GreB family factor
MISTSSPIGSAILNKEEGDEIKVTTPNGVASSRSSKSSPSRR